MFEEIRDESVDGLCPAAFQGARNQEHASLERKKLENLLSSKWVEARLSQGLSQLRRQAFLNSKSTISAVVPTLTGMVLVPMPQVVKTGQLGPSAQP